ncbi:MAG: lipoyl synthase [Chloroflexi bacterium]|nr:lipoyl synthase [Chloroflexota bacterium]
MDDIDLLPETRQYTPRPEWLKVRLPSGPNYTRLKDLFHTQNLHTVCEEALCPNIAECWATGTATIMILGDVCTRGCRFCAVTTGNPRGFVDWEEPYRVARAIASMDLSYVVITSVDRDDLADGGAWIFAETVRQVKKLSPGTIVEVLIPDFQGDLAALSKVIEARPHVLGQNIETVRRLTHVVRDKRAGYEQTLDVLRASKEMEDSIYTKSSMILGFGEKKEEVVETMRDLRTAQVDLLALGQYLRPTSKKRHYPVIEYITPQQFQEYKEIGEGLGFLYVASGPLVRSSYKAWEAAMLFGNLKPTGPRNGENGTKLDSGGKDERT